jgi:putative transposase
LPVTNASDLTDGPLQCTILDEAHSDWFADLSVREIYATLLDEGVYLGSIATM